MRKALVIVGVLGFLSFSGLAETNVIVNGGFETPDNWQIDGTGAGIITISTLAHTGNGLLSLGGTTSNQSAYQTITIPSNAVAASLYFYVNIFSPTHSASDVLSVAIGDTNGNTPTTLGFKDGSSSDNGRGTSFYGPRQSVSLGAYVGRTVRLYFLATLSASGASTFFDIDDVSVTVDLPSDVPVNDNFTNRIELTGNEAHAMATNILATSETGEPNHAGISSGKSLWWKWIAPTNGILQLSTSNSAINTVLAVYTGAAVDQLARVSSQASFQWRDGIPRIKVNVTTGTEYEIVVDGQNGESGGVALNLNFIPKPFALVKGTYAGLFFDTNGVALPSAGLFTAVLADSGKFSAKIQFASGKTSVAGVFGQDGSYTKTFQRKGQNPLIVVLQVDFSSTTITGHLSDGVWTAPLVANRAEFSLLLPAPEAARNYTIAVPPGADPATEPGGYGSGAISVDVAGNIKLTGSLGDGTKVSQKSFVSRAHLWPLFVPLYSGKGLILGWIDFSSATPVGTVSWIKSAVPAAKLYPGGFSLPTLDILGSRYLPAFTRAFFNWTNGIITLQDGNLSQPITNSYAISAKSKITSADKLILSLSLKTGLFKGSVLNPATGKKIPVNGAIVQNYNAGFGCFLGTTESGSVLLGPAGP